MSLSSWSMYRTYVSKSFILLAADWPNTSLQAAIKEGSISSSPMEYGFLHLPICNDIKLGNNFLFYFKCISFTHKEFKGFVD